MDGVVTNDRNYAGPDRVDRDSHEQVLLRRFDRHWGSIRLLDLGVGTGRTWFAYGSLAGTYVGVEINAELLRKAADRDASAALVVADAAQLPFRATSFDLATFSFNGLDYMGYEGRERILFEIRRVLVAGGLCYFSTHSLTWLLRMREQVEKLMVVEQARLESLEVESSLKSGSAILTDGEGRKTFYITDEFQRQQLAVCGFEVIDFHDAGGPDIGYLAQKRKS